MIMWYRDIVAALKASGDSVTVTIPEATKKLLSVWGLHGIEYRDRAEKDGLAKGAEVLCTKDGDTVKMEIFLISNRWTGQPQRAELTTMPVEWVKELFGFVPENGEIVELWMHRLVDN